MSVKLADLASRCRGGLKNNALVVGALAVVAGFTTMALARDDAGTHSFFQQEFAQHGSPSAYRSPAEAQPLTIRRVDRRQAIHRHNEGSRSRRVVAASRALPVGPRAVVSIYEDETLRRGDVVIFKDGLRVFAGSRQFPYGAGDFLTLAQTHDVGKRFLKELTLIARNQPGGLGTTLVSSRDAKPDRISILR